MKGVKESARRSAGHRDECPGGSSLGGAAVDSRLMEGGRAREGGEPFANGGELPRGWRPGRKGIRNRQGAILKVDMHGEPFALRHLR